MFCGNCGNKLTDNAIFCNECGAKVNYASETHSAENIDVEIGIAVSLNNDRQEEFTNNDIYVEHSHKTLSVLLRICEYLDCNIGDICDAVRMD